MKQPTRTFSANDLKWVFEPEARQFCGPLYFTRSLEIASGNVTNNGSYGLVDTGTRRLLVTCYHVWEEFQRARLEDQNLLMCVCLDWSKPAIVLDVEKPFSRDEALDIVTFDIGHLLDTCGRYKFYPLNQNRPRRVKRGDLILFVGFPGHFRHVEDGALTIVRQGFVIGVGDCSRDGLKFISNIKSLNLTSDELGGTSGSPCFLVRNKFPLQLVGFLTKVAMNLLHFTHARCLDRDGTINMVL
jgi:hypothetical protein